MEKILIIDFGGQYSQLIARRVRECRVYSELVPYDKAIEEIEKSKPCGLILSGGPSSVYDDKAPLIDERVYSLGFPVLGICYGMQLMAHMLGGEVARTGLSEFGKTAITVDSDSALFQGMKSKRNCWMSHRDSVKMPPPGFKATARTQSTPVAAFENVDKGLYGVQFHPEVIHTPGGMDILKNFLYGVCGCPPAWTMVSIIEDAVEAVRNRVGEGKAICALSGGVDSSTAALLVHKAIGDRLTCVFVDHGLMRKNEGQKVVATFRNNFHINLIHIDAKERFLSKLKGVSDPEKKRRIIGEEFIRVFEEEAVKLEGTDFLVQGTLYSDVIESGSRDASRIKSHHNVAGLPEKMDLELVEPLRLLFKDEVRKVAEELGLPEEIVWRQPFPGPGLAIRIIGETTEERLKILQEADQVLQEEIKKADLYRKLWQSFAILPVIKSVGVMGDERTYAYPIVIRAVTSDDAMTADWARIPHDILEKISSRIINEVRGVNRVVLDISSKPPSTIEWE